MHVNVRPDPTVARALSCAAGATARLRRLEAGQAVVEFALILPLLALLTMGVIDLGRVFFTYEALANAAREGARYCALHPGDASGTQTQAAGEVSGTVPGVTSSGCTNPGRGQPVTVVAQAPFSPVTPLVCNLVCDDALAPNTMRVRAAATMVVW